MTAQTLFLAMVLAAFTSFIVALGGVSTWLWFAPQDDSKTTSAPAEKSHTGGRHVREAIHHKIAA